ncbi:oligosaccharide flippase family protein [Polaromonas sp. JS666]|uniref:oligosaccharide flippase family protein n=1 Tax=Polaromonas sp. (strain JS666 / ATCC BAA-500) TaxID=296591 RepID=UPI0000534D51|nr:oligosaccharide flippase family protein [Polaromonas sp. JS666]ABE45889.1 polysaccharide biosynthesis protein [Polaromonas sp. JS666]
MKLGRNLLAGIASSAWSALVGLTVVPFYLKYLGIEAYGLIGFFLTTQALLQLLDMGMAPTINREVARYSASGNLQESGTLLHTLAMVYWAMAVAIAVLIAAVAPWIAQYWIQSRQLSAQTVSHAVVLMGLVVACRWPIGLYQGALIGAERLTVLSGINIVMTTAGSVGAVAVLALVSPTIEAFFVWQACMGLVYAVAIRGAAWRIIGKVKKISFDIDKLKSVWRFTANMSGIGLTALVITQLDKVILSKTLGLEEFGHYMLAMVVVTGLQVFITPLFNVIYPRFSALVVNGEIGELINLYRLGTRMLATVLFPIAMVLAIFAEDLVLVWTGNPTIASSVAPIMALMALGSAVHGTMYFPYALQLAFGMPRLALTINTILMTVMVPLIIGFSLQYGALGGAMAWLVLHVSYLLLGTWMTHRHLLKGTGTQWLFHDVGIPFALSVLAGLTGHYAVSDAEYSFLVKLIYLMGLSLVVVVISIFTLPEKSKTIFFGIFKKT